ncbi:ABC transporter ATP-binding protein [Priestia aryabhattai]|uniref:ABC transporter ATP-binding protein n=1 Tax=Priestia aryabhattai TaxID=412384 RepID=UPI000B439465|nr:ABC transporter ATP-binding protein [Priestia aryabhattai]MBZ6487948.1 ABC transporter ATP-binding protein [Priestia aryabhattai]MDH3114805.1 ABC transporter ATP-binding protein [Priestia aryabhattai]MDH3133453.1 ABC transporter ATP-binding protein [Priestia aryabhattai]MED4152951.1 ABC transporter ATP-binding protein [Priestia aryabhattai]OUT31914.1 ABC transporter ATP-binding protein [Priestia aryabhattai]
MTETVLQVDHVSKVIGKKTILHDVSLSIERGEIFGLLGPNGSGKTTLIRTVVGLIKETKGTITVNGFPLKEQFTSAMKSIGAIIENPEFYDYLTGYQNLKHFANMHEGITAERLDEVVALVKLENSIHAKVKTYSLGMRQRLGVAQAILHKPALLLLDEPTNGLDPAGMREFRTYLQTLCREEGISILIASHLLKEVEALCDRVGIIQDGELKAVQDLSPNRQDQGMYVEFEVSDVQKAAELLSQEFEVTMRPHIIDVAIVKEQIPAVNKKLVDSDILVYRITPVYETLEDSFMSVTEGEHHA